MVYCDICEAREKRLVINMVVKMPTEIMTEVLISREFLLEFCDYLFSIQVGQISFKNLQISIRPYREYCTPGWTLVSRRDN